MLLSLYFTKKNVKGSVSTVIHQFDVRPNRRGSH